jgi:hypothetical protein
LMAAGTSYLLTAIGGSGAPLAMPTGAAMPGTNAACALAKQSCAALRRNSRSCHPVWRPVVYVHLRNGTHRAYHSHTGQTCSQPLWRQKCSCATM